MCNSDRADDIVKPRIRVTKNQKITGRACYPIDGSGSSRPLHDISYVMAPIVQVREGRQEDDQRNHVNLNRSLSPHTIGSDPVWTTSQSGYCVVFWKALNEEPAPGSCCQS